MKDIILFSVCGLLCVVTYAIGQSRGRSTISISPSDSPVCVFNYTNTHGKEWVSVSVDWRGQHSEYWTNLGMMKGAQ